VREKGGVRPRASRVGADPDYPQPLLDETLSPSPRACAHAQRTRLRQVRSSKPRLARSPPDNERQKRATSDLRLRVPASVPGIPQDVATRGAVSRGERAGTMPEPRERRRVATVTAARGAVSGEARAR